MNGRCKFIKKALLYILVLSLLLNTGALGILPMQALAADEPASTEYVFYVDGTRSGDKDGSSAANAFATVAAAYAEIPEDATKTTIVICGNVTKIQTDALEVGTDGGSNASYGYNHWCLPANSGEVVFTSVYGDEDYRSNAGLALRMNWYLLSDTTFENIRITSRAATVYANYNSLHLGEGVDVSANGDKLFAATVYLGTYSQINGATTETNNKYPFEVSDIEFTMKSGGITTLYGGGLYSQSYLGDSTLGKDHKVTLNIEGGSVTTLYGSGKGNANKAGAHHSSIQVNVSGGSVGTLYGASQYATVYDGMTVTISGGTVTTQAGAESGASITGSKTVEYTGVTSTMPTATGFDTVKLTNATVTVPSLDTAAQIQATDDSKLTVSTTAPAAAVSVTLSKAGEAWNTANALITAPAGTAEGMFALTNTLEEGYSWAYASADSSTTWKLATSGGDEGGEGTDDPAPTNVLYVDGVGSGNKDGSSKDNAFATMADA